MLDNPSILLDTTPPIILRKAEESDIDFINNVQYIEMNEILMAAWGNQFNWKSWFDDVKEASMGTLHKVYLIYSDQVPVGFIWLNEEMNSLWITAIVILSQWQRKGIGTNVLQYLIGLSKSEKKKYIELGVQCNNLKAKEFYAKLGFIEFDHIRTANTDLLRLSLNSSFDQIYII